jgi:hypothetical protein
MQELRRVLRRGYVGPGDLVPGAVGWWGLRAYSKANIGLPIVRMIRASDSLQQDFCARPDGMVDFTAIDSFAIGTTAKYVTWYDQSGNGHNLTQGTNGNRPNYTNTVIGRRKGCSALFVAANSHSLSAASVAATSQPYTISSVVQSNLTSSQDILSESVAGNGVGMFFSANKFFMLAGTNSNSTNTGFTNNTPYALQFTFNGASSHMNINGVNSTMSANPGAGTTGGTMRLALAVFLGAFDGYIPEVGLWNGDTCGSGIGANQQNFWGF